MERKRSKASGCSGWKHGHRWWSGGDKGQVGGQYQGVRDQCARRKQRQPMDCSIERLLETWTQAVYFPCPPNFCLMSCQSWRLHCITRHHQQYVWFEQIEKCMWKRKVTTQKKRGNSRDLFSRVLTKEWTFHFLTLGGTVFNIHCVESLLWYLIAPLIWLNYCIKHSVHVWEYE